MARDKRIDTTPWLIPANLAAQLHPGTFEHAVDHLLAHAIDLSGFDARFRNETTGAPVYPSAVLLKVVLCTYSRGIVSSGAIARLCDDHVTFIPLCGARTGHFTTIAAFVSTLGADIAQVFAAALTVCDQQGLIGRQMFAIDGVKPPSSASKRRSGKRADFERQAQRMARLEHDAAQLRTWLATPPDERRSAKGAVRLSNRTDPDSAKMATGKGVVQGDTAVAAVDAKAQILVDAQAHGTGTEQELLLPVVAALAPPCTATTVVTADAGYHSEANLRALAE